MRKRYYIMFVARDADGELVKMPIPLHYLYMFIAGAIIGMLTITGMAGSYTRMLVKVTPAGSIQDQICLRNQLGECPTISLSGAIHPMKSSQK